MIPSARFLIYQVECAPTTNAIHLQGYVYFPDALTMSAVKAFFPDRVHLTKCNGSPEENINYCSKSESAVNGPFEFGRRPRQGSRQDWWDAKAICEQGGGDREILDLHPHLAAQWRGVDKLREVYDAPPPARRDVVCVVLWGATGVGKTYRARMRYPDSYIVRGRYIDGRSFDNYRKQSTLILDEWKDSEWPLTIMNTLCDEWGSWLNCRYNNKWTWWTRIIITTNYDPSEMYFGDPMRATILRRVQYSVCVTSRDEDLVF